MGLKKIKTKKNMGIDNSKEKDLEKRVEQLEKKVEKLQKELDKKNKDGKK